MANIGSAFCDICEVRHLSKAVNYWCLECDEGLCMECHEHHSISKSSRQHSAIPIEKYNKLPSDIASIVNYCTDHDRKFENYCPKHQKPCCAACISADHKSCTNLLLLQDVMKNAKTSALLDSIEIDVKEIKINLRNMIEDRQKNLASIHEQRKCFDDEIEKVRTDINFHLDCKKQYMVENLDASEKKAKSEIEILVTKLLEKEKNVDDSEQNISTMKMYATDLQVYMGCQSMEREVHQQEKYLQSLFEDGSLHQVCLQRKINYKLSNIEATVNCFGTVGIDKEPSSFVWLREQDIKAQTMPVVRTITTESIDCITLSQKAKFTVKAHKGFCYSIFAKQSGITILPDGRIILSDSGNKKLFVFNSDGIVCKSISFETVENIPFDVTYIKGHEVALSTPIGIQIIDIDSEINVEHIHTDGECQGIAHNNGTLICYVQSKGIQSIQISNKTFTTLVKVDERSDQFYIAVRGNQIYGTNFSTDVVSCYTFEGTQLWQFKDTSILHGPTGIDVDNNSNVYVASYKNNRVIVLSSDGKKLLTTLTSKYKDDLNNPRALLFDEKTGTLLVTNERKNINVYHIA